MCLAVLALDAHPHYAAVIAANRDEYHARAAAPAKWWPEGWLAGRDLAGGGTWLGVTRSGRWAFLTNVREPGRKDPAAPTRGTLVTRVLAAAGPALDTLHDIAASAHLYNGFNLLAGDARGAAWLSNRAPEPHTLPMGYFGMSNAALDTPWPKVTRTRDVLAGWCEAGERDPALLFEALASRDTAPDEALPCTGIALDRERLLSAAFILDREYGTRCSTVLLLGRNGEATFEERSFDPSGRLVHTARLDFAIPAH